MSLGSQANNIGRVGIQCYECANQTDNANCSTPKNLRTCIAPYNVCSTKITYAGTCPKQSKKCSPRRFFCGGTVRQIFCQDSATGDGAQHIRSYIVRTLCLRAPWWPLLIAVNWESKQNRVRDTAFGITLDLGPQLLFQNIRSVLILSTSKSCSQSAQAVLAAAVRDAASSLPRCCECFAAKNAFGTAAVLHCR